MNVLGVKNGSRLSNHLQSKCLKKKVDLSLNLQDPHVPNPYFYITLLQLQGNHVGILSHSHYSGSGLKLWIMDSE